MRYTTAPPSFSPLSCSVLCHSQRWWPWRCRLRAVSLRLRSVLVSLLWCRDVLVYQTERGLCSCLCSLGQGVESCFCLQIWPSRMPWSMSSAWGRFFPTFALTSLQSWRCAFLWQPLDSWGTRRHPYYIFCLHPYQPSVHGGPSALSCSPDGRAQWSSGSFALSHTELLVAYGACRCPELWSGL